MEQKFALSEKTRRAILDEYNINEASPDKDFDDLIGLAAVVCEAPVAYLGIIESEIIRIKSGKGINLNSIERKNSFSQEVMNVESPVYISTFSENPVLFQRAAKIFGEEYKFYAGVALRNNQGYCIAVLSLLDTSERELTEHQKMALEVLGNQCMKLFEFGKQSFRFEQVQEKLKQKYHELEKFASIVSHDIKSPLANIISLTELLKEENKENLNEETMQYLDYLVESSYSLRNYVDGILSFYRSDHILEKEYENVDLHELLKRIAHLYDVKEDVIIEYPDSAELHLVNKSALTQIFLNLISNALKYNNKPVRIININFAETEDFYHFEVVDNGEGFSQENASKIFELFTTLDTIDREGNPGSGIGLATVQKLVTSMGGNIKVKSVPGEGSTFSFTIRRYTEPLMK